MVEESGITHLADCLVLVIILVVTGEKKAAIATSMTKSKVHPTNKRPRALSLASPAA
jgi:hypothetical protein